MKVIQSAKWADTERVLSVEPELASRVHAEDISVRRLNYYSGRTLTKEAMDIEAEHHDQHLAMFGRQLSDGVVYGLELSAKEIPNDDEDTIARDQWHFSITPGLGVTHAGDDVSLRTARIVRIADIPTYDDPLTVSTPPEGIGIIVLEPIKAEDIITDRSDSCELDPDNFPFEDQIHTDGARLLWYPWPESFSSLPSTTDARLRNEIAYKIYTEEKLHPDVRPPWEEVGVALALVNIDSEGVVEFVDRHAVVRQGGTPLSVLPKLNLNGTPFLWQARTDGLTAQIQEIISAGESVYPALDHFRYLPPFGVIPKEAMDFDDHTTAFFPSQYRIEAAPVPVEEIEVALEASASLDPFDLYVPDRVKILVPVPQTLYEPELLLTEQVDPVFIQTLLKLIAQVKSSKSHRDSHRVMSPRVQGVIDPERIDSYPDPDPGEVPDEFDVNVVVPPYVLDADDNQGVEAQSALKKVHQWITDNMSFLKTSAIDEFNPSKLDDRTFTGLVALIKQYNDDIKKTNDHLDSGFMQLQSESYRLRQLMLGNEKASRLSTSPALANVLKGQLIDPTPVDVNKFFDNAKDKTVNQTVNAASTENVAVAANVSRVSSFESASDLLISPAVAAINIPLFQPAVEKDSVVAKKEATDFRVSIADFDTRLLYFKLYTPLIPFRTLGIKERIYQSASVQVRNNAVRTKASVYQSLVQIPIALSGLKIELDPNQYAVISKATYDTVLTAINEVAIPTTETVNHLNIKNTFLNRSSRGTTDSVVKIFNITTNESKSLHNDEQIHLTNVIESIKLLPGKDSFINLDHVDLAFFTRSGILDPEPVDADEADYFSAAISSLEKAIATLRLVEQRLGIYELALIEMKQALATAISIEDQWQNELVAVMDKLAEYRHDLTITRALYEEEKIRVAEINIKRKSILANHVKQLVYVRPRMITSIIDVPDKELYSEYRNPVPACLKEDYEATDELDDMLDLFREVPLSWLPHARVLVKKINHPEKIKQIMRYATQRANLQLQYLHTALTTNQVVDFGPVKFGNTINKILTAYNQTRKNIYQNKQRIKISDIDKMSWKEASIRAQSELSLSDLIEAGKGTSKTAKKAIVEMENLEDVAVCFYNRCGEVEPSVRLRWADAISIFDKTPTLKDLSILPGWPEVDFEMRRELQGFVDWLFTRVDARYSDAIVIMNDLVRICILLASHAPVSSIISGHVPKPVKGKVGDIIDLNLDKGRVGIGMKVALFKGKQLEVQGVVEDMTKNAVRVKVIKTSNISQQFEIEAGSQAKFLRNNIVGHKFF